MSDVDIHHDEELLRIASWGRILMIRFVGAPGIEQLRRVRFWQGELVRKVDGKVAMMSVIAPRGGIQFDDETRKTSAQLLEEMKPNILVGTQIVLKQGFFGAMVRSVMMGVNMMSKPGYPSKVCSSLSEGADFVAEHLTQAGHTVMPDDIVHAISTALEGLIDQPKTA